MEVHFEMHSWELNAPFVYVCVLDTRCKNWVDIFRELVLFKVSTFTYFYHGFSNNFADFFEYLTDKKRTDSANSGDNLCAGPTLTKHALFFAYSRFFAAAVAA